MSCGRVVHVVRGPFESLCPALSRFKDYRPRPGGTGPLYWRDEVSGELAAAVNGYLEFCIGEGLEPSRAQLVLLVDYCRYWINAPCWTVTCEGGFDQELKELRESVQVIASGAELRLWLRAAFDIALDPL